MIKKIMVISVIFGFLLPSFCLAQNQSITPPGTLDYNPPTTLPGGPSEAKTMGEKGLKAFPEALREAWQEAWEIWQKMADWAKNIWNSYIWPKIEWFWQKILAFFGKEVEKRKPIIEEEFQKEKKEIKEKVKEELPKVGESLWERLKELIK